MRHKGLQKVRGTSRRPSRPLNVNELLFRIKKKAKRRQECIVRDLAAALILCNNVTPVTDDGQRVLQASSPD